MYIYVTVESVHEPTTPPKRKAMAVNTNTLLTEETTFMLTTTFLSLFILISSLSGKLIAEIVGFDFCRHVQNCKPVKVEVPQIA